MYLYTFPSPKAVSLDLRLRYIKRRRILTDRIVHWEDEAEDDHDDDDVRYD